VEEADSEAIMREGRGAGGIREAEVREGEAGRAIAEGRGAGVGPIVDQAGDRGVGVLTALVLREGTQTVRLLPGDRGVGRTVIGGKMEGEQVVLEIKLFRH